MGLAASKRHAPAVNIGGVDPFTSRLANVEVQSIMNQLSAADLLRFSRCSHRLHALADHPLAWKHLPITLGPVCNLLTARLLRHRPCKLVLDAHSPQLMSILNSLHREPWGRVEELDARLMLPSNSPSLAKIVAHEALKDIKTLRFRRDAEMRDEQAAILFQAIAALPALHTLVMEGSSRAEAAFAFLSSAPDITRLHFVDNSTPANPDSQCLRLVSRLPYLRHLSVESPALSGDRFLRFFAAPLMANLETLRIDLFHCNGTSACGPAAVPADRPAQQLPPVPSADFAIAMSAMTNLHSIHLCRVTDIDVWIAALPNAPALRALTIQPDVKAAEYGQRSETRFPTSAVLSVALSRMPLLRECIALLPVKFNPGDHVALCLDIHKLAAAEPRVQLHTFSKPDDLWS